MGAAAFGVVREPDVHGDVFFRKLCHGGREDHLRTEMAELHGFGVAELVDDAGRRDHAGIGGHHSCHIGPFFQYGSVEEASGIGGAQVAASPAQGRGGAVGGASDEALHEEQVSVVEACMGKPVLRGVHVEPRCAVLVIGAHELEGVEPLGLEPKVMAMAPKDGNRQAFAQSGEFVVGPGTGLAEQVDAVEQVVQVTQALFEFGFNGRIGAGVQEV